MPLVGRDLVLQFSSDVSAEEVVTALNLLPLAEEGGFWRPSLRTEQMNSIYYLMTPTGFSALHRLTVTEGWQWLAGSPALQLQLMTDGSLQTIELGSIHNQALVSPGVWQGAKTLGGWTLVSCWCTPAFTDNCFELGDAAALSMQYPTARKLIEELTR